MKNIENGHFHHTLFSALICVLVMAVAGVLVGTCSLDKLCLFSTYFNFISCEGVVETFNQSL